MYITDTYWLANSLGILSSVAFLGGSLPVITKLLAPTTNNRRVLLTVFRWGLVIAIFFGLSHGLLMTQKKDLDFYDATTYWSYLEGAIAFNLLILLAFTFDELKFNLKKLVYLTSAGLLLLICHLGGAFLT